MSNIEWTDVTWNPVIGCAHVAEGCRNCYAEKMSKRLAAMGQDDYAQVIDSKGRFNGKAIPRPDTLAEPLHWRKPRKVFVNSMSDLFHKDVPFEFIAAVYGVVAACPQHTFQILTKRPERMLEFMQWVSEEAERASGSGIRINPDALVRGRRNVELHAQGKSPMLDRAAGWPLPNVWHGVSVAEQKDADKNIPILLQVPSAIRFVSAEPLIGDVYLQANWLDRMVAQAFGGHSLDWVIAGGESGPGARPCDVAWIRSIVQQCKAAGVACFVKQLGKLPQEAGAIVAHRFKSPKCSDPPEWPEDLRVREFPAIAVS